MAGLLLPPEHAALSIVPFALLALMLAGLPKARHVGTEDYFQRDKVSAIKRPVAEVSVAVLQGRDLVAGDAAFSTPFSKRLIPPTLALEWSARIGFDL